MALRPGLAAGLPFSGEQRGASGAHQSLGHDSGGVKPPAHTAREGVD